MCKYNIIRLMDYVKSIGEDSAKKTLSDFSCEYQDKQHNIEVENFLQKNAIDFSRQKKSITYIVLDEKGRVTGYFTLAHKPIIVKAESLISNTSKKKMGKYAKYDSAIDAYSVSAFLLAQFSKNYFIPKQERISGDELMDQALSVIEDIQEQIGGGIVFLECEDHDELINFYSHEPNRFFRFGERYSESDGEKYIQLMRFL